MSRLSKHCRALTVGAAASAAVLIAPAAAEPGYRLTQVYPAYPAYPSERPAFRRHHADAVVRSLGLTPMGPAERHGPVFVVHAMGQEGTPVQVTLDRRSGRVLQITRLGPGAPRIARVRPAPPPGYEPDGDEEIGFPDDEELPSGSPGNEPGYRGAPSDGPRVIRREGIRTEDLPPPGTGPRVVTRDPDVTNSIPRALSQRPADPLLGVPKEFRGGVAPDRQDQTQQKLAARPPADASPPLPRPRPADAPAVAQKDPVAPPAAKPQPSPAVKPKPNPEDVPDALGFE